jgi:alpha-galactosidase
VTLILTANHSLVDGRFGIGCDFEEESMQFNFGFRIRLSGGKSLTERDFASVGGGLHTESNEVNSYVFHYDHSDLTLTLRLDLFRHHKFAEWTLQIENRSTKSVEIESVSIGEGVLTCVGKKAANESWRALNIGLQSTDMHVGIEALLPDKQHYFDSVTVLHHDHYPHNMLLGCTSFQTYFSHVLVQARGDQSSFHISIANHFDHTTLLPGASVTTEKAILLIGERDHDSLFKLYMDRVCGEMKPISHFNQPATGWLSWYYYYGKVSEDDILDNVRGLQELNQIQPEYVVIDSGWFLETGFGDWEANSKFPDGMKSLANKISEAGYKPGLWFSPLLADAGSILVREHPDWLLMKDGVPVAGMNPNGSDVLELHEKNNIKFVLDLTNPEVLEYLRILFHRVVHEWGFRYIKLDFLVRSLFTDQGNHSSLDRDQIYYPHVTTVEAYRNAMKVIREAAGKECYILGCAAPLFASMGDLIDANRMTPDITRRNYVPDSIRPTAWELVKICSKTMAARYFLNGRAGFNDPDVLVIRGHEPEGISDDYKPTLDEVRAWAGVVALSGGLLFYNDKLTVLEEERKPILNQLFPVGPSAAVPIDFFNTDAPEIWKLPLEREGEQWTVLGVFNWGETTKDISVDLAGLGFKDELTVHGVEFWSQDYLNGCDNQLQVREVLPHSMRLIAIRTLADHPQLIGTDMHFTQGWAEFTSVTWEHQTLKLQWKPNYKQRGKVIVYIPSAFLQTTMESNADFIERTGHILTLSQDEVIDTLWVRFEHNE